MVNRTIIILLFIIAFVAKSTIFCIAQNPPQPYFQNYSTEDGLPSPEVYCIFQDSKGYIWIGTDNGAARFDGYNFKNYSAKDGLTQNVVLGIHEDNKERIWLSTMNGEMFIFENDTIVPYQYNDRILKFKNESDEYTYSIAKLKYIDEQDNLYINLTNFGFLILDKNGNATTQRKTFENLNTSLFIKVEHQLFGCRISAQNHSLYWGLLFSENAISKPIVIDTLAGGSTINLNNLGVVIDSSKNEHLFLLKGNALLFQDTSLHWRKDISDIDVNEIRRLKNNTLVTCNNRGKGIYLFENIAAFKNYQFHPFLQGTTGNCLFEDREGGLWIGTKEEGVYYTPNLDSRVYNEVFGFQKDNISALATKNDSILFVGDVQGDIHILDIKNDIILETLSSNSAKGEYNYDLIYQENLNTLFTSNGAWKGTSYQPHQRSYLSQGRKRRVRLKKIMYDGALLHGIHSDFVYSCDHEAENPIFNLEKNEIRRKLKPFSLYQNHESDILIGTEQGIFYYGDTTYSRVIENPLLQTRIEHIDQLSDNTYVFATKGKGVVLWKDTIQAIYTESDRLASDMIEKVCVVNDTIWVATLNGLSRIVRGAKEEVRTFNISTGLPSNEIYDIEYNNGQIWLATAKGLVRFQVVFENKFSPSPHISHIEIGEEVFTSNTTATVNYQQNNIRVDYVTFSYRQQGKIPYRYRLHTKDRWVETRSTTALFTDLRPRHYAFEVQSQNEDGYWSESSIFSFHIKPAWYATWWFIAFSGFLISSFIYWRFRRLRKQAADKLALKDQELAMQAQIRDLERSALQAQMNPHFIFNCLNSIQNFIIENDQKNAVKYLSKFAHLTRQILNLSIDGKVNLVQEMQLLENYLSLEKLRFKNKFDYQINIAPQINQEKIEIPPLLVQPFIENAIIHGMGRRAAGGKIEVNFSQSNNELQISVFDNGLTSFLSLEESTSKHKFKSVGISITKKRLALLNEADEENMIQFDEIRNENNKRIGTKVSIVINI